MNIYQTARIFACFTQEEAAELLHISPRTLSAYETGEYIPPDDTVCSMVELYGVRHLAYMHLKNSTEVGRRYLPEINLTDLAKSVLKLQKEVGDLAYINSDMIEIACDGKVDEYESVRWSNITREVQEVAGAALAVTFSR